MNKKEMYDKKIEIMKVFLESDGDIDVLVEIQNKESSKFDNSNNEILKDKNGN